MNRMNKHLVDFIDDELKNNSYYESIRKFAEGKDWEQILGAVVNEYVDNIDSFGPYRFMDAIEDFLSEAYEDENAEITSCESLYDVICKMWEEDAFEQY